MKRVRLLPVLPLFSLGLLGFTTLLSCPAHARAADENAAPLARAVEVADPMPTPLCQLDTPAQSWKVPVNQPSVPIYVVEDGGATLVTSVSVSPTATVAIHVDASSRVPGYSRRLDFEGVKGGEVYDVTVSAKCTGAADPKPLQLHVEFTAEAAAPVTLGVLTENPQGLTLLTPDSSFLPYLQLSTISFEGRGINGTYSAGHLPKAGDRHGVVACVNGACATPTTEPDPTIASPLPIPVGTICAQGRATGVVELDMTVTARILGGWAPLTASGKIHVDCTKASDTELGHRNSSGCSTSGTRTTEGAGLFAIAGLGACIAFGRARRRSQKTRAPETHIVPTGRPLRRKRMK